MDYGDGHIPDMSLHGEVFKRQQKNAYDRLEDYPSQGHFEREIALMACTIENQLDAFLDRYEIDLLVPNNIFSLGVGFPIALAFYRAILKRKLFTICHHHDFYWERPHLLRPTCDLVRRYQSYLFPPSLPWIRHVVINRPAGQALREHGCVATVIPNVFDFDRDPWTIDDFNRGLRAELGLSPNDLVFLQGTRVSERKAIELSIQFVAQVQQKRDKLNGTLYNAQRFTPESKIVLFMPGLLEAPKGYILLLKQLAEKEGVSIIWASDTFGAFRGEGPKGKKYSLWDAYAISDWITYPSVLEGWGNQFLEGLFAKKPMLVFEYPVYKTDIEPFGFQVVSLGDQMRAVPAVREGFDVPPHMEMVEVEPAKIASAADRAIELLKDPEGYRELVEINFQLGKSYFSYTALSKLIASVLPEPGEME